jgi:8-oxo-dGTP pyrophosphatase MutT (NUDIX family)
LNLQNKDKSVESVNIQNRLVSNSKQKCGYDTLQVGGGLSVGYGILETAIKEAAEEASIPAELIAKLRPAGCVS